MAVPTTDEIRQFWNLSSQTHNDQVSPCLAGALDDVKVKIGIEAFNQVFSGETADIDDSPYLDENVTTTDEEALRLSRVTRAVFYYTGARLVLLTGLRIRPSGLVKREQDAGSPAMTASSAILNEYLSPQEMSQLAGQIKAQADAEIAIYVIQQEPAMWGVSKVIRA